LLSAEPEISQMPQIRGWVGGRGWGKWRGRMGGLTMPSDIGDQAVCTVARQMATANLTIP